MRQAVLAGISALLMSVLLPGWLLPMQSEQRETPLVLIVEQPRAKRSPKMLTLRRGEELLELKNMFWSIIIGFVGEDYSPEMLYSVLLVSGGNQHQHEFLQKLIEEKVLEG